MELLQHYTNQIEHVHDGIYHAKCGQEVTDEEMHLLYKAWYQMYGDDPNHRLIISRDDIDLAYRSYFDFGTAMKLVAQGRKVTLYKESYPFYIYMNQDTKIIMEQILPLEENPPTSYMMDDEDVLATDWMIYREE